MNGQKNEKTWVYVIDDNFQIVYSNHELKGDVPQFQSGQPCYRTICRENSQCRKCPLRRENTGKSILFDSLHNEWVSVGASRIEWPGVGKCHMILCESVEEPMHSDFFNCTEEMRRQTGKDTEWCMIAIDIEKFKLFNEWHGREAGDRLLAGISDCLYQLQAQDIGIVGFFEDDDFAFFMQYDEKKIKAVCDAVSTRLKEHSAKISVLPAFGIYQTSDTEEPVYRMYDRAKLACAAVKGNYITRIKKFEPQMLEALESEFLLLADIQDAFQKEEFTFVLQPKCDMKNGKIVGAEALARWNSTEKGVISPGVFVPFLEKSGLISELDTYIWEAVCQWQRSMLDQGRKTVPVSVNISRMDICSVDVPMYFKGLIEKYNLDPRLIEVEITESAYAENLDEINRIVMELHEAGFRVLMDDFGSAYSSLNMLKDIAIDVIKMDMRFLDLDESNAGRGVDILETVCNMAQVLGLDIVAEGVETEEQKTLLLKSGCSCGQGYYFYRPLTISDFEKKIEESGVLSEAYSRAEPTEMFYLKDLLNKNLLSQNMLSNILGAVAFYDVCEGQISVVRYNEQYAAVFGSSEHTTETRIQFGEQLYKEEQEKILWMFDDAKKNRHRGSAMDVRRRKPDGTDMWLHLHAFFLYQRDGHAVFYSTVNDVTEVHENNAVLRFLNNDMPGGYYRHLHNEDGDFTHISQRFLDMFGFTREEIKEEFDDKFTNMVHPEDREKVLYAMSAMKQTGGNYSQPCRMRSKNGYISVLDQSRLIRQGSREVFQGIILCNLDHYMWLNDDVGNTGINHAAETLMPCGVFQAEADGGHQFAYISNSMLHMLGYTRQDFEKKFGNSTENMIYAGDRERVTREIDEQIENGNFTACEFRVEMADGSLKWFYNRGRLTVDANGKRWFYVCITDYDYLKRKYEVQEWQFEKYRLLLEIPGMLVYDYDPQSDRLTYELSLGNGKRESVVAENYVENIAEHNLLSEECIDEQRKILREAGVRPVEGITELKGRFGKDGELKWYRFHYRSLVNADGKVYRVIGRGDHITDEKQNVSIWKQRAMRDPLTGLLNYEAAKMHAADMLEKYRGGVLILLDLDNFKKVNDTYGHLAGNELLLSVAENIRSSFRSRDVSARFGGDEFFVFMPGTFSREKAEEKVRVFFEKMDQIRVTEALKGQCSIGVAMASDSEISFDTLFRKADEALYQSKRNGRNRYTFYK